VRDGDVVLVPHGYHGPCVAAPGYPMYYLNVLAGEIRKALDDAARQPRFIRTVHGVGYAFCGEAVDDTEARVDARAALCWLTWKGKTFPLAEAAAAHRLMESSEHVGKPRMSSS